VAAHVLTIAHRYRDLATTGDYHRAAYPAEVALISQSELETAMAPILELADQLQTLTPVMDRYFDAVTREGPVLPFHCGGYIDGITAQTNWLGELLLHGPDIARAVNARWELTERDMLLIARGLMQIGPFFVEAIAPSTHRTLHRCRARSAHHRRPAALDSAHAAVLLRARLMGIDQRVVDGVMAQSKRG